MLLTRTCQQTICESEATRPIRQRYLHFIAMPYVAFLLIAGLTKSAICHMNAESVLASPEKCNSSTAWAKVCTTQECTTVRLSTPLVCELRRGNFVHQSSLTPHLHPSFPAFHTLLEVPLSEVVPQICRNLPLHGPVARLQADFKRPFLV